MLLSKKILVCVFFAGFLLAGCGGSPGGSGGSSNPGQPTADFSIAINPQSLTIGTGSSQMGTVSISPANGFNGSVSISTATLPAGVSVSPSSFTIASNASQTVTFTASPSAAPASSTITFQATAAGLSHSATVQLNVTLMASGPHAPIRARYLRTNSYYDPNYLEFAPPHFTVYDPIHKRFYVSNPYMNEIDVFDAVQEVEIAEIPVPGAWGIDLSPVGTTLYAGTTVGDIYEINTQTNQVTNRYLSSSIGSNGFAASEVFVMADGRLAIAEGVGSLDGLQSIGVWNPTTNALDTGAPSKNPFVPATVCPNIQNVGAFAVSGDRTRVLAATVDTGLEPICSYDPATRQATTGMFPQDTPLREIIPSPDGTRFFLTTNLDGVAVYDAKTLQLLGQITQTPPGSSGGSTLPNAPSGAVISQDGKMLYLTDQISQAVAAYDTSTYAFAGWVPSFRIGDLQDGPVIAAIDETGLIVGPTGHGVDFLDASKLFSSFVPVLQLAYLTPTTGPTSGGTVLTSNVFPNITTPPGLQGIYVGNPQGGNASYSDSPSTASQIQVTTPPANATGAVDLSVVLSNGSVGIAPEGFSYGPTILEVLTNAATAEGGQTGSIAGYGFGQQPGDVQVSIGGHPAQVVAVNPNAPIIPYPFPVEVLQFTIPPGSAGSTADVTVTTASGATTLQNGFHYVAATASYPGSATLQAGLYDPTRDLYYFADKSEIQVFSKTGGAWLTPITLPGTNTTTQLLAISESPDGSKLAVSDFGGQQIYVLDPDTPGSAESYPMSLDSGFGSWIAPAGLAITNSGVVYFATADIYGTGTPAFHKLVTSTRSITDVGRFQSGGVGDNLIRVLLSPDGSRVYSNIEGASFWLDTSNDEIHYSPATSGVSGSVHEMAISADGSTVDADSIFADNSLNPEMPPEYVDWETWLPSATTGQKLNRNGSLLFQPLTDGIDILARNTGRLLYRLQIPISSANAYDSLFMAENDVVGIVTNQGIAFIDLSTLPIPSSLTGLFPSSIRSGASISSGPHIAMKSCSSVCVSKVVYLHLKRMGFAFRQ